MRTEHTFFPEGALLFMIGGEMTFLYADLHNGGTFHVWHTGIDYPDDHRDVFRFLDECVAGQHSASGTSMTGTFKDCIDEL